MIIIGIAYGKPALSFHSENGMDVGVADICRKKGQLFLFTHISAPFYKWCTGCNHKFSVSLSVIPPTPFRDSSDQFKVDLIKGKLDRAFAVFQSAFFNLCLEGIYAAVTRIDTQMAR